jgi:hypothetical protein
MYTDKTAPTDQSQQLIYIYTTYKSTNVFFSKTTQQMYTDKTAPTDQSQQLNLTIQIHVIPPNQNYWVHSSFYNDGLILIPSSAPASTGTISGTISTNAKIDPLLPQATAHACRCPSPTDGACLCLSRATIRAAGRVEAIQRL